MLVCAYEYTSVQCADRRAHEGVRTGKSMLIGQRCLVILTLMTRTHQGHARPKDKHTILYKKTERAFEYRQTRRETCA